MLIRAYGEYWSPGYVDWGPPSVTSNGTLIGIASEDGTKKNSWEVDMWSATAVYCLYFDYQPVYVGRSKQNLGTRLKHHLTGPKSDRWNAFSWYSMSFANKGGVASKAGSRKISAETTVKTIEAVAIRMFDPLLNRRHESIEGAIAVEQFIPDEQPSFEDEIQRRLDELFDAIKRLQQ